MGNTKRFPYDGRGSLLNLPLGGLPSGGDADTEVTGYLFVLTASEYASISSTEDVWTLSYA